MLFWINNCSKLTRVLNELNPRLNLITMILYLLKFKIYFDISKILIFFMYFINLIYSKNHVTFFLVLDFFKCFQILFSNLIKYLKRLNEKSNEILDF